MNKTLLAVIILILAAIGVGYVGSRSLATLPVVTPAAATSTETSTATTSVSVWYTPTPVTTGTQEPVIDMSGQMPIVVGRSGRVGDFTLKLNSMVADNRCPVDVQCIEAGAVTVSVTVQHDGIVETRTIASDEVPHRFGKYRLSIINVAPEARSTVRIGANGYTVTFYVELHQ